MLKHREVKVHCPWLSQEIGIDEAIVELIKELWRLDIRTTVCCQDSSYGRKANGEVWIDLEYSSYPRFAGVIRENADIKWHVSHRIIPAYPWDVYVSVAFPSEDYNKVLSHLKDL